MGYSSLTLIYNTFHLEITIEKTNGIFWDMAMTWKVRQNSVLKPFLAVFLQQMWFGHTGRWGRSQISIRKANCTEQQWEGCVGLWQGKWLISDDSFKTVEKEGVFSLVLLHNLTQLIQ